MSVEDSRRAMLYTNNACVEAEADKGRIVIMFHKYIHSTTHCTSLSSGIEEELLEPYQDIPRVKQSTDKDGVHIHEFADPHLPSRRCLAVLVAGRYRQSLRNERTSAK
jgi:hypothetical protein